MTFEPQIQTQPVEYLNFARAKEDASVVGFGNNSNIGFYVNKCLSRNISFCPHCSKNISCSQKEGDER